MDERRQITRVEYNSKGIIVFPDTLQKYTIETDNISPLGMAFRIKEDIPDVIGKDAIIVTTLTILYVKIIRMEKLSSNEYMLGAKAINFPENVLNYLFKCIGNSEE